MNERPDEASSTEVTPPAEIGGWAGRSAKNSLNFLLYV